MSVSYQLGLCMQQSGDILSCSETTSPLGSELDKSFRSFSRALFTIGESTHCSLL
jgi:hypothetical protein